VRLPRAHSPRPPPTCVHPTRPGARSGNTKKTLNNDEGYSKRGEKCRSERAFFHKGKLWSVCGFFTFDDGFIDMEIVPGGFNRVRFLRACKKRLVRVRAALRLCEAAP
jgi:hypothetical protein